MTTNVNYQSKRKRLGGERSPRLDREAPLTGILSFGRPGRDDTDQAQMFRLAEEGVYVRED